MKKLLALPLVVICAMTLLIGCLAKEGLQGPPGKDGTDGLNGAAAVTSCLKCHTDSNWTLKNAQYSLSKHFYGNTSARGEANKFCARCHTDQGFQEVVQDGMPIAASNIADGTRIQCITCHKMSNFDDFNDTIANAMDDTNGINSILRTTSPVTMMYLNQNTLTGWNTQTKVDNSVGKSKINNLCITCHQIRYATSYEYTQDTSSDTTKVKLVTKSFSQMAYFPMGTALLPKSPALNLPKYSAPAFPGDSAGVAGKAPKLPTDSVAYMAGRSFAVHDGNQSNMRYGRYAYGFGASIDPDSTRHHAKENCTYCHMNKWDPITGEGGHTLKVNLDDEACNACHHLKDTIATTQAANEVLRIQLGDLMVARKMATKSTSNGVVSYTINPTHDFFGKLYSNNAADSAVLYASLTTANKTDTATGAIKYINMVTYSKDALRASRIGRKWTYGELGAAYNYGFYTSELTKGAHNNEYAKKLLQASINWLQTHP